MKLIEMFYNAQSPNFLEELDEIDQKYNEESYHIRKKQEAYYQSCDMDEDCVTPVFTKPEPTNKEDLWSTDPNDTTTSPGYIGRENAKRRAGHRYDKDIRHEDPHSDPAIPGEEQEIIAQAKRRLGRHITKN